MKKITLIFLFLSTLMYGQKFEDLALTPPMGWNSWNYFQCEGISETVIMEIADAMSGNGMKDAGYEYIVIDDCWQVDRDENGVIITDSIKFPSGIKKLADYIHSKGLKFGIYSDAGTHTCGGRPGSKGYEMLDAQTYAEWEVDYLKYDWGYSKPWEWAKDIGHLWRTTLDISDRWDGNIWGNQLGWTEILEKQVGLEKFSEPGHWNDPGKQGFKILDHGSFEIWQKPLKDGKIAICLLNLENEEHSFEINWEKLKIKDYSGYYYIKDLWKNQIIGNTNEKTEFNIPARDIIVLKLFVPKK